MVKDFQLRFFSSIFLFVPLFLLFSKNILIFLFVIQSLLSISLWEFLRLKSFKDNFKGQKKINILLSRHKISSLDFLIIFIVNVLLLLFFLNLNYILIFLILIFFLSYTYIILKFDFEKLLGLVYCSAPFFILIYL